MFVQGISERRALRRTREGDHIADVAHAVNEQDEALQAKTEARVWNRAEPGPSLNLVKHPALRALVDPTSI